MNGSPGLLMTLLAFVAAIGPLIFLHELGHYLAARWFGVKAETFSIGFGRRIAGWRDKRGTDWQVGWLPLGGYVKFAGDMNPASVPDQAWLQLPPEERNQTFQAKPLWQRAIIVAAGPVANFLVAIAIFMAVLAAVGESRTPPVIAEVVAGSAAARAGLQPGDRIVRIGDTQVSRFEDIRGFVALRPGETLALTVRRDNREIGLTAVPTAVVESDRFGNEARIGRLGIVPGRPELVKLSAFELPGAALRNTGQSVVMMVVTLRQLVLGQRAASEMAGPVRMAKISGEIATLGITSFVLFVAFVSINLGFINLLPIPMLDGGHLAMYAIEAVRRKPLGPQATEWAFRSGLMLVLALMLFVTINDIASLRVN